MLRQQKAFADVPKRLLVMCCLRPFIVNENVLTMVILINLKTLRGLQTGSATLMLLQHRRKYLPFFSRIIYSTLSFKVSDSSVCKLSRQARPWGGHEARCILPNILGESAREVTNVACSVPIVGTRNARYLNGWSFDEITPVIEHHTFVVWVGHLNGITAPLCGRRGPFGHGSSRAFPLAYSGCREARLPQWGTTWRSGKPTWR